MRLAGLLALVLAVWGGSSKASPAAKPASRGDRPVLTSTVTGARQAAIRPAPGRATRLDPAKPPTTAQRRAALRRRISVLEAEIAGLQNQIASASTPGERAALQVRLDARRQELLAARRADARLGRRAREK